MIETEIAVARGVARVMVTGYGDRRDRELSRQGDQPGRADPDWAKRMAADFPGAVVNAADVDRIH